MHIKQRHLEVFDAVIASGSISRAAAQLNLSQPAVSIALANLERIPDGGMFGQLARLAESAVVEEAGDSERAISLMNAVADRDPGNAYLSHRLGDT